jgi:hypothetical protein
MGCMWLVRKSTCVCVTAVRWCLLVLGAGSGAIPYTGGVYPHDKAVGWSIMVAARSDCMLCAHRCHRAAAVHLPGA